MQKDFYFGMKVSLKGEQGIVVKSKDDSEFDITPGIIRWDTSKEQDFEDWRGLYSSFRDIGGIEIDPKTKFKYLTEEGIFKGK